LFSTAPATRQALQFAKALKQSKKLIAAIEKIVKKILKKRLTNRRLCGIIKVQKERGTRQ
jgi:hypothetical protein